MLNELLFLSEFAAANNTLPVGFCDSKMADSHVIMDILCPVEPETTTRAHYLPILTIFPKKKKQGVLASDIISDLTQHMERQFKTYLIISSSFIVPFSE
jgi:hypothetical protein